MKRPRRWTIRICVVLLLGAIVNVAVAWGGFHRAKTHAFRGTDWSWLGPDEQSTDLWSRHASEGWPEYFEVRKEHGWLADVESLSMDATGTIGLPINPSEAELKEAFRGFGFFDINHIRSGFPFRSASWEEWSGAPDYSGFAPTTGDNGWHFAGYAQPRTPIWPGFAINTLFYSAILWLLFFAPFTFRRWRRIRRGQCPACAYPVDSSDVCTECGKPVVPTAHGRLNRAKNDV